MDSKNRSNFKKLNKTNLKIISVNDYENDVLRNIKTKIEQFQNIVGL